MAGCKTTKSLLEESVKEREYGADVTPHAGLKQAYVPTVLLRSLRIGMQSCCCPYLINWVARLEFISPRWFGAPLVVGLGGC